MKKTFFSILVLCSIASASFAQSFIPAFDRFSGKEIAYIYLANGTKLEGTIDDINRKKGLIEEITIIPTGEKKKRKIEPKEIKTMYLPASGYNKLVNSMDQAFDAQKWKNNDVNMEIINKGYAYFENVKVKVKKDTEELLMQMVNPAFSSKIKVFHDPLAQESMSFGYAGITMAGGDDKSYYVQVGNGVAEKLKKKEYDDAYLILYKDCPVLLAKLKNDHRWTNFDKHLVEYTTSCK
ncbi:hypothetical protein Emtol_1176 [Emticicia oligotrophica DSM 17448]|uniref:Uncharacterized protein n=1 Tax=Emticicia oligotrophica (strain DSM 17448 / CIP 109782 / MTCC 6937 / GPTSA100-15) TaxID=929562 RepID=A0ABN4AD87_EMTOG|nr:hypothetical protein [Emticicia oligotrophica]AFK02325.1 hypothetical protein Emtol_1176 [Emticicia oligotrophica DSM 17448]